MTGSKDNGTVRVLDNPGWYARNRAGKLARWRFQKDIVLFVAPVPQRRSRYKRESPLLGSGVVICGSAAVIPPPCVPSGKRDSRCGRRGHIDTGMLIVWIAVMVC